jgi:outer membrane protein assembly factor BamE (lipoprotein component of BamABCDE complex)
VNKRVNKKFISALFCILLISSCSIVERKTEVIYTADDKRVPEKIINSVRVGKTTKNWLVENLGEPNRVEENEQGLEDYLYEYTKNTGSYTSVFLLYSAESREQITITVHFEFEGDILKKYWAQETALPIAE